MSGANLLKGPFLPPRHEALLGSYYGMMNGLDVPSKSDVPFEDQVDTTSHALDTAQNQVLQLLLEGIGNARLGELEHAFQARTLYVVATDLKLAVINRMAALGAGIARATDDTAEFEAARDIGHRSIDFRARHAATGVLTAFSHVGTEHRPTGIDDESMNTFDALMHAAVRKTPTRDRSPKRFRTLRALPAAWRAIRNQSSMTIGALESQLRAVTNNVNIPPELNSLSSGEISHNMRVADAVLRHIGSSAVVNPGLGRAVEVQNLAYTMRELRAYDIPDELANFDTNVSIMARREAEASQRPQLD